MPDSTADARVVVPTAATGHILADRIRAALADLDRIPALHRRGVSHPHECGTCNEPYPCETVQATIRIYRTLTGEDTDHARP